MAEKMGWACSGYVVLGRVLAQSVEGSGINPQHHKKMKKQTKKPKDKITHQIWIQVVTKGHFIVRVVPLVVLSRREASVFFVLKIALLLVYRGECRVGRV